MKRFAGIVLLALAAPVSAQDASDVLRTAISNCWVVEPESEAANVVVEVAFGLTVEGKVVNDAVTLVRSSDAPAEAVEMAFQSARRAILRCQGAGFALPVETYQEWRDVVITFDPPVAGGGG
jgi:hypothetical protein